MPNAVVNSLFQQYLGRNATDAEDKGFADAIASGVLDPIGLSLYIQGSSEYQRRTAPGIAKEYSDLLGESDNQFLERTVQRGTRAAVGEFRRMGRPVSSGLDSSVARVVGDASSELAQRRQGYIAPFTAGLYSDLTRTAAQGGLQAYQTSVQRRFQNEDYYRQKADMERYYQMAQSQAKKNQRNKLYGSLIGAAGMAAGAYLGGPAGSMIGGQLGQAVGPYQDDMGFYA